ncbi:MAG: hypothetical protein U9Q12_02865 [Patescibacteria group bacterium]|nr:hypothetical protein [Patescibacteria group bacterium]
MKKIIIVGIFLIFPLTSFAQWDDCPFGETDGSCVEPGKCGRYTDSNSDHICDHSQENPVQKTISIENSTTSGITNDVANTDVEPKEKTTYPLFMTIVVISLLYIITYSLAQNKKISMITHKKIWNSVLTVSFAATIILSIILIIRVNLGYSLTLPFDVLYWHVVTGLVMMVVAFFHIGWHWRYYKNLFKK